MAKNIIIDNPNFFSINNKRFESIYHKIITRKSNTAKKSIEMKIYKILTHFL